VRKSTRTPRLNRGFAYVSLCLGVAVDGVQVLTALKVLWQRSSGDSTPSCAMRLLALAHALLTFNMLKPVLAAPCTLVRNLCPCLPRYLFCASGASADGTCRGALAWMYKGKGNSAGETHEANACPRPCKGSDYGPARTPCKARKVELAARERERDIRVSLTVSLTY
jgi:hypothetical protein